MYQKTRPPRRDGTLRHGSGKTFNLIKPQKCRRDNAIDTRFRARRNNIVSIISPGVTFKPARRYNSYVRVARRGGVPVREEENEATEGEEDEEEIKGGGQFAIWTTLGGTFRRRVDVH